MIYRNYGKYVLMEVIFSMLMKEKRLLKFNSPPSGSFPPIAKANSQALLENSQPITIFETPLILTLY